MVLGPPTGQMNGLHTSVWPPTCAVELKFWFQFSTAALAPVQCETVMHSSAQARICQQCGRRQRGRPELSCLPTDRSHTPTSAMLSSVAHPLATYPQLFCQNTRRVPPATAVLKAVLPSGNLPPTILNHSLGNWKPPGRLVSLAQALSSEQSLILLVYSILLLWP